MRDEFETYYLVQHSWQGGWGWGTYHVTRSLHDAHDQLRALESSYSKRHWRILDAGNSQVLKIVRPAT